MTKPLHIAIIQLDIVQADKFQNISQAQRLIGQIANDVDMVVLPEMFATGFITDIDAANRLAEPDDGLTIDTMSRIAAQNNVALLFTTIIRDESGLKNRMYFIDNCGNIAARYDKHHLFAMSTESDTYIPGELLPPIVAYRGYNIAMAICFDLRFPAWLRNHRAAYDVLIIPASWPDSRQYAWQQLLIARAIENQAYVIGANRTGFDPYGNYSGTSIVVSPKGQIISCATTQAIITATLDLDELNAFRKKFPVCNCGDKFIIQS